MLNITFECGDEIIDLTQDELEDELDEQLPQTTSSSTSHKNCPVASIIKIYQREKLKLKNRFYNKLLDVKKYTKE